MSLRRRCDDWSRSRSDAIAKKGTRAKEYGQPLESRKGKEVNFHLESPEGTQLQGTLDFNPLRAISNFWHPEL